MSPVKSQSHLVAIPLMARMRMKSPRTMPGPQGAAEAEGEVEVEVDLHLGKERTNLSSVLGVALLTTGLLSAPGRPE